VKKKLFVVSDIHGHYTLLRKALAEAGFDEENPEHIFLCCGDLFDRGTENRQVYDYIRNLKHKILVRGNHDERLAEVLTQEQTEPRDMRNGMENTLTDFFGRYAVDEFGRVRLSGKMELAHRLRRFVEDMLDYFETEHYVFVHGWLPLVPGDNLSRIREDWRTAGDSAWHYARFLEWQLMYGTPSRLPDKTIVCGHRATRYAHFFDPDRDQNDAGIFYGRGVTAIDGCTVLTGKVNILVLEEEM
jgi:serine/threonine protein phosphatase 1